MEPKNIDHLFRHHYGKMVSVLTRIFGLAHLETIEDAVQDTFVKATLSWEDNPPEHPEAWLTKAAKNRVLDIFRKLNAEKKRVPQIDTGMQGIVLNELFLDDEINDSQLRMIFTACHPNLDSRDRISFALKTVSGFSIKEIASALLMKEETVKKRLSRSRKVIEKAGILFQIPQGKELLPRLESVMEVLYLIFNEGFHSNKPAMLVRKDLCSEAIRLCKLLFKNKATRTGSVYALFALMCFHAARLDTKMDESNELLDLKSQDRSKWYFPLMKLGDSAMNKAVEEAPFSSYHYEAAIAAEHLKAATFEETNWRAILNWYEQLYQLQPMPIHLLNMAVVCLQKSDLHLMRHYLNELKSANLGQRTYLLHATWAEYYLLKDSLPQAIESIDRAIAMVTNKQEKSFLENKRVGMLL